MSQSSREQAVRRLKAGKIDLIVATDVAARGLDIDRISHVFNFDIPLDVESYVHRIGRTGRAGSKGIAILFVTNRERWMLKKIERFTNSKIPEIQLPSYSKVIEKRKRILREQLLASAEASDFPVYEKFVAELLEDERFDPSKLAAAAIRMAQGDQSLEMKAKSKLPKVVDGPDDQPNGPRKSRKPYSKSSKGGGDKPGGFKKRGYKKGGPKKKGRAGKKFKSGQSKARSGSEPRAEGRRARA